MKLEDFAALKGMEIGVSKWFEITQSQIDAFAQTTHDHQFIHVDPVAAAQTPFGTTIAHGFLTLSLLSAMLYGSVPQVDGVAMGVNYGMNRMRFLAPVKVGARVRGRFTLKEIDLTKPAEFTTIVEATVEIEGEDKPALVAEWIGRRYLETS